MTWLLLLGIVAAPFALLLLVACLRQPLRVALPLYAALIPFGDVVSVGNTPFGSASSLVGLVLAVGLLGRVLAGGQLVSWIPAAVPVWILFLGLAIATTLWSLDRPETYTGLAVLGSLVTVFVLAAMSRVDRDVVRRTENGLMAGGVAVVLYGLYQLVILGGFVSDQPGVGIVADGRFGNGMLGPNIESVTLLLPMAIALHRALIAGTGTGEAGLRSRTLHLAVALLMLVGIFMTGSRTGTLAVGVVLLGLLVTSPRRSRNGLLLALAVGAAAATVVWVYHPLGLTDRTFASATSTSGRSDIWEVGLAGCREYCDIGSGWGTFPDVYAATQSSVPGARVLTGDQGSYQPHNVWLLAVVETGVAGVLLFSAGLLITLRDAWRLPEEYRGRAVGSVVGLAFALLFLSSMEFKIFWIVLLLVTMYVNAVREEREQAALGWPPGARVPVPA